MSDLRLGIKAVFDAAQASPEIKKFGDSLKKSLGEAKEQAGSTGISIGAVGAAVTGAGIVIDKAMSAANKVTTDYGKTVITVQRLTGMAAKESSQWAAVLDRYGVTGVIAGRVIKSMDSAIVSQSKALNEVGVRTQDAEGKNRSAMDVLADLAEYYSKTEDKTKAVAVASGVLGRNYLNLIPILDKGREGIKRLNEEAAKNGLIWDQDTIDRIKKYNGLLKDNEEKVKGLQIRIGEATIPMEIWKTETLGGILDKLREINPELPKFAGGVGSVVGPVAEWGGGAATTAASMAVLYKVMGTTEMGTRALARGTVALRAGLWGAAAIAAQFAGSTFNKWVDEVAGKAGSAANSVKALSIVAEPLAGIARYNSWVIETLSDKLGLAGDSAGKAGGAAKSLDDTLADMSGTAGDTANSVGDVGVEADKTARALNGTMVAANSGMAAFRNLADAGADSVESQIAQRKAVKELNAELREHHRAKSLVRAADKAVNAGMPETLDFIRRHKKLSDDEKAALLNAARAAQTARDRLNDLKTSQGALSGHTVKTDIPAISRYNLQLRSLGNYAKDAAKRLDAIGMLKGGKITVPGGSKGNSDTAGYAAGTITRGPERALIGEDGTEVVIPVGNPKYRAQAMGLLEYAKAALGVGNKRGDIGGEGLGTSMRDLSARANASIQPLADKGADIREWVRTLGPLAAMKRYAQGAVGDPYVWGAAGPNAFDCSGLASAVLAAGGLHYGRFTTADMPGMFPSGRGNNVTLGLVPGHHTGIQVAGGWYEAPHAGANVRGPGSARSSWPEYLHVPGFRDGGTATGPESGYPVMLHGTETVTPGGMGPSPQFVFNIDARSDRESIVAEITAVVSDLVRGGRALSLGGYSG